LGNFNKHVVGVSTNKGLKTTPKSTPTPCKNTINQHRNQKWHNLWMGMCLWRQKKWTKGTNLEKLGLGEKIIEMGVKSGNGTGDGDGWRRGGAIVMRWWIWVVGFEDLRGLVYGV
jgi:hypothetical protein